MKKLRYGSYVFESLCVKVRPHTTTYTLVRSLLCHQLRSRLSSEPASRRQHHPRPPEDVQETAGLSEEC